MSTLNHNEREFHRLSVLFNELLKSSETTLKNLSDFLLVHQSKFSSMNIYHIHRFVSSIVAYTKRENKAHVFEVFFLSLPENLQTETALYFNPETEYFDSSVKNTNFYDMCNSLTSNNRIIFDFYQALEKTPQFDEDTKEKFFYYLSSKPESLKALVCKIFETHSNIDDKTFLSHFFSSRRINNANHDFMMKVFLKRIYSSENQEATRDILDLLYSNKISFVHKPNKLKDVVKAELFYTLLKSNNLTLFKKLVESKSLSFHPSYFSDDEIWKVDNIVDFINISQQKILAHDLKSHIFQYCQKLNIDRIKGFYYSDFVYPKYDLLNELLNHTSTLLSISCTAENNSLSQKEISFVKELFELIKQTPEMSIPKNIMRMELFEPLKKTLIILHENTIINKVLENEINDNSAPRKKRI